jgi:DNA topoisomerase-1
VSWNEPVNERCPQCGEILFKKKGKKKVLFCENKDCGYEKTVQS